MSAYVRQNGFLELYGNEWSAQESEQKYYVDISFASGLIRSGAGALVQGSVGVQINRIGAEPGTLAFSNFYKDLAGLGFDDARAIIDAGPADANLRSHKFLDWTVGVHNYVVRYHKEIEQLEGKTVEYLGLAVVDRVSCNSMNGCDNEGAKYGKAGPQDTPIDK